MDEYQKVKSTKLKFKGNILPTNDKHTKSKKKKKKTQERLQKFIIKPGEESTYHPVEEKEDYRTEAEKKFDEHLSQKEKDFIEKRAKMSYKDIVEEINSKLDKLTDHNDLPRIAAAGLGYNVF